MATDEMNGRWFCSEEKSFGAAKLAPFPLWQPMSLQFSFEPGKQYSYSQFSSSPFSSSSSSSPPPPTYTPHFLWWPPNGSSRCCRDTSDQINRVNTIICVIIYARFLDSFIIIWSEIHYAITREEYERRKL